MGVRCTVVLRAIMRTSAKHFGDKRREIAKKVLFLITLKINVACDLCKRGHYMLKKRVYRRLKCYKTSVDTAAKIKSLYVYDA